MNEQLKELEEKISYHFQDKHLLAQALTHSSYANEHRLDHNHCNERLEFLGDAVLEIVTSDFLYHKYTEKPEGDLTKIRASIVCEPILQEIIQSRQDGELSYEILKEEGPDHNKSFEVRALVGDQEIGRGKGRTKKAAEQLAAYNGILKLKAGETCI